MSTSADTLVVVIVTLVVMVWLLSNCGIWPTLGARVWHCLRWLYMLPWAEVLAARRSEALLCELLTASEYQQLCAEGYLEVASPTRPGRIYRVPRGPGQVRVVEDGQHIERLCLQPARATLPDADVVLMHKLLIQTDEETYLRTANHFLF
jgi:hypothetical protein